MTRAKFQGVFCDLIIFSGSGGRKTGFRTCCVYYRQRLFGMKIEQIGECFTFPGTGARLEMKAHHQIPGLKRFWCSGGRNDFFASVVFTTGRLITFEIQKPEAFILIFSSIGTIS